MQITTELTDEAVLRELGARLARTRLERNLTQAALGGGAGVGLNTVRRLEDGQSVTLTSFVRVLRYLRLLDTFEVLIPKPVLSPIERLELRGKQRQRARHRAARPRPEGTGWAWGDEPRGEGS
ncbi:MAG TPA: helix-turn-helix domain-containing protein [Gaiellaceae bacterium]